MRNLCYLPPFRQGAQPRLNRCVARRVLGVPEVEALMQAPPAPISSLRAPVALPLEF